MEWTLKQAEAIAKEGNLLVAAAAGSGKTAVLAERIVRLIREGADVSEFLVVTFTRAAAGEMKKRIAKRLLETAEAEGDEKNARRLYMAASNISQASISTFHAFCAEVLKRHFHAALIDPSFRIAEEFEVENMLQESLDALFEEYLANDDARFKSLISLFHEQSVLREAMEALYKFMLSKPDPFAWLSSAADAYAVREGELLSTVHAREYVLSCKRALDALLSDYTLLRADLPREYALAAAFVDDELTRLRALLLFDAPIDYLRALQSVEFEKWRGKTPQEVTKPFTLLRGKLKKLVAKQLSFLEAEKEQTELLNYIYPHLGTLGEALRALDVLFLQKKAEARVVDFNDLEHMTLKLLKNEAIAEEYREKLRYIFVDEYQDSNAVQESILACITRENASFFVGDVKQSIYRFRLADPKLFLEKYALYGAGRGGARIDLSHNFRSAKNIVSTVNAVFSAIMSREGAEIDYDENAALRYARGDDEEGCAELNLIVRASALPAALSDDGEEEEGAEETLSDVEYEATAAATRIHALLQERSVRDEKTGKQRALKFSDIVILHRSPGAVAERWVETLSLCGVPCYAQMHGGYFDAVEVRVFLELLSVLDNRRQDVPLAAVLRSPIGNFDASELIALRAPHKEGLLFDALEAAAKQDTLLGKKARVFLERLSRWHEDALLLSVEELMGRLMDETGYYEFVSALPEGKTRQKNLDALLSMARSSQKSGARSLAGFLAFAARMQNTNTVGAASAGGADVVRFMSIHASKGLEFPVVLLVGLNKRFNREDVKRPYLFDSELGLGIKPTKNAQRFDTLYSEAVAARRVFLGTAEEMRLLYVAMTRARDALILMGTLKNPDDALSRAAVLPSPITASRAQCFLDWLLPAFLSLPAANELRERLSMPALEGERFATVKLLRPDGRSFTEERLSQRGFISLQEAAKATDGSAFAPLLTWRYPYETATLLPSKVSVTGLARTLPELSEAPDFMRLAPVTGAERGAATHALMERISLKKHTTESVRAELEDLKLRGILTEAETMAVSPAQVAAFFASPLGERLIAAEEKKRELAFNCRVEASALLNTASDEPLLLQGVIDCCFKEGNEWVLLDYKTDYLSPGTTPADAAKKHARQIALYKRALTTLTGLHVKESYIIFLRTGDMVPLG